MGIFRSIDAPQIKAFFKKSSKNLKAFANNLLKSFKTACLSTFQRHYFFVNF